MTYKKIDHLQELAFIRQLSYPFVSMEDMILRTVGQFQLKQNLKEATTPYYVENTILTSQGKESKSYNFGCSRKETLMIVSDSEFVSRAIQSSGNNI